MTFSALHFAGSIELILAVIGAWLLWRFVFSAPARAQARNTASPLPPWNAPLPQFLMFVLFIIGGSLLASLLASTGGKLLSLRGDAITVFNGAAAQLGMLGAVTLYWSQPGHSPPSSPRATPGIFESGVVTFLVALPLLIVAAKVWELLLTAVGLPTDRQDLIGMFAQAESPWLLATMIALAVLVAPLTEELVFRAGLFRWLRTRIPRWAALVLPALFFASLHVNWSTLHGLSSLVPLALLAVIFSLAYQRTGRIGTPIVAHALFNLNTVLLVLLGDAT